MLIYFAQIIININKQLILRQRSISLILYFQVIQGMSLPRSLQKRGLLRSGNWSFAFTTPCNE